VIAVAPVPEEKKPEPPPVVATPEPAPQPAPKVEPAPALIADKKPAKPAPAEPAAAVAPGQPERQVKPEVALAPPAPVAVAPERAPTPKPEAEPAAPGAVEVRPFADVIATAPAPSTPAEPQPEIERAPVRPLQDRPPAAKPAIAAAPAPAAKPEPAPAPRVSEAAAEKKPAPKPAPVIVQAPAEPAAAAESAAAAAPLKFDIERYLVEGNTLLKPEAIGKALQRYTGKQKDFADVQRALEALQIAYQDVGYGAVQVTLPEQELERGEVRFEVIEIRIGKVEVQGNEYYSERNIRRSVPALKEGETPDSHAIARSLKVANENPTKQTQMSMKAGSKDGEVDATIKVVDTSPRKYSVSFDNTGTATTGQFRLGFGFQHSNLFDRDHSLTLQYITNPEHVNKVTVLGAGYRVPLYGRGDSIDFIMGYSDVDSGTVQNLFNVSGAGLVMLGRYNQTLDRIEEYEHKLTYGIDYKAFQNRVTTLGGAALVPDITLHPVSVSYSGVWRKPASDLSFYASLWYNPFPGGNDAAQSDFAAARGFGSVVGQASAEYVIWRYGGVYTRLLPDDWTLRALLNGQTTRNALVAGEQFGLGGANSVRGFNERAYSNDKGHQASLEIYTPDLAGKFGFPGGRLKLMAFYDTGTLGRNFINPGEQTGMSVDSIGLGLRLSAHDRINLRLDYAQVMHDGGVDAGLRDGRRNANTLHASLVWVY
jgi:hemolysin activation/secretion protein